jgi:hypothetical protein
VIILGAGSGAGVGLDADMLCASLLLAAVAVAESAPGSGALDEHAAKPRAIMANRIPNITFFIVTLLKFRS